MQTVVVDPERRVGCLQCTAACAVAHSRAQTLYGAISETPRSAPRIHVGPGPATRAFPNKCRHCDPAPCMGACMTRAITRDAATAAVLVNPARCINCGMCSMACPFGVIRYARDWRRAEPAPVAVKCDNCVERQKEGREPACVETCLVRALRFGDPNELLKEQSRALALQVSLGIRRERPEQAPEPPPAVRLWRQLGEAAERVGE